MTSRTSFCNGTLLKKTMSRYWPMWVAYFVLWLLILPMDLFNSYRWHEILRAAQVQRNILRKASELAVLIPFIAAPIAARATFSHLYHDRACGVFTSLPVKRQTMFCSCVLAGLLPLLFSHVVVFAVTMGVEASLGVVEWSAALSWLGMVSLNTIAFYGFAVLCGQLTGNSWVLPAVYFVLSLTAVAVESMAMVLLDIFLVGYETSGNLSVSWLSPVVQLSQSCRYDVSQWKTVFENGSSYQDAVAYALKGWGTAGIYAGVGAVLTVLAGFVHQRRRMESAGDVVSVRFLQPVFKFALSLGCALALGTLFCGLFHDYTHQTILGMPEFLGACIICLLGGFIGYFAAEMLNKKTFRVFAHGWKGFALAAAVIVLSVSAMEFDFFGYETYLPKAEKISDAEIWVSGMSSARDAREGEDVLPILNFHQDLIDLRHIPRGDSQYNGCYISLYYTLENGKTVSRGYNVPVLPETRPFLESLENYMNDPDIIEANHGFTQKKLTPQWFTYARIDAPPHTEFSLTSAEAYDFYMNYVLPDLREGNLGQLALLPDSPRQQYENYECYIYMDIVDPGYVEGSEMPSGGDSINLAVNPNCRHILSWLWERGVTELRLWDSAKQGYNDVFLNPYSAEGASSIGIIGGADGPTAIIVS